MKNKLTILSIMVMVLAVCGLAYAQAAPAPTAGSVIGDFFGLVKSWKDMSIYAAIALLIKLIVDGIKVFNLWDKIPAKLQSYVVVAVGAVTVGLTTLATGGTFLQALSATLGSSGVAMLMHEMLDDLMLGIREKLNKAGEKPKAE